MCYFFFFKQKTAYEMRISDWSSDVCSSDLPGQATTGLCPTTTFMGEPLYEGGRDPDEATIAARRAAYFDPYHAALAAEIARLRRGHPRVVRSEEHTSELQSLMRISYAVFCLKKKKTQEQEQQKEEDI